MTTDEGIVAKRPQAANRPPLVKEFKFLPEKL